MRTNRATWIASTFIAALLAVPSLADDPAPAAEPPVPAAGEAETPAAEPAAEPTPAEPATAPAESDEPAAEPKEDSADDLFDRGRDALFTGNYDEAIRLLKQAVEKDPDKTKTSYRLYLARAYGYSQQDPLAAPLLEEILQVAPDHAEAGRRLAEIYAKQQAWQKIVDVMEPLLKYRHDYPTYHLLAEANYQLNHLDKARKHYQEATKLNPESAADHYQLGNICLAKNLFALAADSYEAALRLGVESPVLHYKLASAYFNQRNYFGRIAVVTVKAGQPGTISEKWYLIECVAGRQEQFRAAPKKSAIYHVGKAIEGGLKDRPDIHLLRANIYLNARRYQQAHDMYAKLAASVPKEEEGLFYFNFAQSAFGIGNHEEYLKLLGEAISRDKDAYGATLVDAYVQVAEQYNQAGDLDQYITYLAKAVAESPRTASLHLKLGNAFEEGEQYDKAIEQWQMVLDLEPDHPHRTRLLNQIEKHRTITRPAA
jgi:tetratricopeptide (TPR) repeat protein